MKKFLLVSAAAAGLASVSAFGEQVTGYVSDAHCGLAHNKVSDANTACIKKCVGGGSDPVLVSSGKVMKFDAASKDKVASHLGEQVKVDGTVEGDVITVSSIEKQ